MTAPPPPGKSLLRNANLQIIFGVTLMAVMGVASITPAFPTLIRDFGITPGQVGLLITFFTLPGVILAPVLGVLADRYGRKRILVPSLLIFAAGGLACGLVRDFHYLLAFRAVQGIGAASLGSINTTVIGDLFSGPRRPEAMGYNASVLSIGTASYPAIGGALALLGWYYPFYLPILAVPVGILVLTRLHAPEPKSEQSFRDYLGGAWSHLKNIRVLGLLAAGTITFIIIYGTLLTYLTLLIDERFNASSFVIGLTITAMSLTTAAVSSQLGRLNRRFSLSTIIVTAFVLYAIALFLIPQIPSLGLLFLPMLVFGAGQGMNIPSLQTAVAGLAPIEYRAAFMSINATMLRLGQTLGPPLIAMVYVQGGYNATFYVSSVIAIVTAAVGLAGRSLVNRRGSSPDKA